MPFVPAQDLYFSSWSPRSGMTAGGALYDHNGGIAGLDIDAQPGPIDGGALTDYNEWLDVDPPDHVAEGETIVTFKDSYSDVRDAFIVPSTDEAVVRQAIIEWAEEDLDDHGMSTTISRY